jgi:hypothetical protein
MAFVHGKDTKVYINSSDYSSYFSNADSALTSDVAESTTFGATGSAKTYIAGLKDGTIGLSGFWDSTADGVLQPLLGGADFDFAMGVDGLATGDRAVFAVSNITNYGVSSPVGDIVATSVDVQSDDGIWNGSVLTAGEFASTAVHSTTQDNGASTSNSCGAFVICTSVSGTSPTADIKLQHSADDVSWADLITFTQITAVTSEVKSVASGTTINRYIRVYNTIGGSSTPTINAIVGFGRNN